ncbi:MAG TPA: NAD(P)-dependent alcohol dehydrogenase [Acidimicrobiales bacterium]|nr:NAD(P)-dependent alcohol dehydrogenase [Acidimicrobiales bacterium]
MPDKVMAMAAASPGAHFEHMPIERRDPGAHDVVIDIAYTGICHTDVHQARQEWGPGIFPMVPGHEIAGTVSATGEAVSRFRQGDRVGVGCYVYSCRECPDCRAGEEQYCQKGPVWTYNASDYEGNVTYGGYSARIVADENYVLRIPGSVGLDVAAPLLCAGITLYSPLVHWGAGPGKRVAVVGMGGLGHMGVQIAAAMGAEVTVLSHTLSKRDDGLRFGAVDYRATSDPTTFTELARRFDLIVNTLSVKLDVDAYVDLLARDGCMVIVGLPAEPCQFKVGSLTSRGRALAGSQIGGIRQTQEMLDFCADHKTLPEIEVVPCDAINTAYDRIVRSDVRYRFVIDMATLV